MSLKPANVVIDTNVILSRYLFPGSIAAVAIGKVAATHTLIASDETVQELMDVFRRPKFAKYRSVVDRNAFVRDYLTAVTLIDVTCSISVCRDPRDDKFLELAISGRANLILTGDADLLAPHPWQDIEILSPADYLSRQNR